MFARVAFLEFSRVSQNGEGSNTRRSILLVASIMASSDGSARSPGVSAIFEFQEIIDPVREFGSLEGFVQNSVAPPVWPQFSELSSLIPVIMMTGMFCKDSISVFPLEHYAVYSGMRYPEISGRVFLY